MQPNFKSLAKLDVEPVRYYDVVQNLNLLVHEDLKRKIIKTGLDEPVTILLPGSDGRKENANSEFEVVVVLDADTPPEQVHAAQTNVTNTLKSIGITQIEFKMPGDTLPYYSNNPSIVQPGRVFDGAQVYGEPSGATFAKKLQSEQIINLPSNKIDRIEGIRKAAKKVVSDGGINKIGGMDRIHYDLEAGLIFYDPNSLLFSFKIGPLRLVQNTLLLQEVKKIRREMNTEFAGKLETGILPRINQLKDEGLLELEKTSISELSEIYAFFLKIYHLSEINYRANGNTKLKISDLGNDMKTEIEKKLAKLVELTNVLKIK